MARASATKCSVWALTRLDRAHFGPVRRRCGSCRRRNYASPISRPGCANASPARSAPRSRRTLPSSGWYWKAATNESEMPRNGRERCEYANVEMLPVPIANDGRRARKPSDINSGDKNLQAASKFGTIMSSRRLPMSELVRTSGHESRGLAYLFPNTSSRTPNENAVTGRRD